MTALYPETYRVDLDILVPTGTKPAPRERVASSVTRALAPAIERIRTGCDLAQALDLPAPLPVDVNLRVIEGAEQDRTAALPIRATISGGGAQPMVEFDAVADALGDLLYETIQPLAAPADAMQAIGGSPDAEAAFDLQFGGEAAAWSISPGSTDRDRHAIFDTSSDGGDGGWGKGCHSWPW
jgi:hypothetical protein